MKPGLVLSIWLGVIAIIMSTAIGCDIRTNHQSPPPVRSVDLNNVWGVTIVKVRGCEYIQSAGSGAGTLTHCGDCSNPIHRTGIQTPDTPEQMSVPNKW